ncbi:MAG: CTP synthase, partial [Anaerolineae bacterium]
LFCDVDEEAVIPMVTTDVLYEVPLLLEKLGVAEYLMKKLKLAPRSTPNWSAWEQIVSEARLSRPKVKVALVGKYVELHDAYMSVREALTHAALALGVDVDITWVHSADLEKGPRKKTLRQQVERADGVVVPGGFGSRGIEGKIWAAKHAREGLVPYLGLCLGMQLMVIEFGRHILGEDDVNSTEFDRGTSRPVIDLMPDQKDITDKGATMRLGVYPCCLNAGSKAGKAYNAPMVDERHRHRFEFNNAYRAEFAEKGMVFSGLSPDGRLVEIAELREHPFMVGTQFHPEFLSRPTRPHPLFVAFLRAACERAGVAYNKDLTKAKSGSKGKA